MRESIQYDEIKTQVDREDLARGSVRSLSFPHAILNPILPQTQSGCGCLGDRRSRRMAIWLLAALLAQGCAEERKVAPSVREPPVLDLIQPQLRKIVRVVGQPSFVQSYERTSIYAKLAGYIEKWNVDIGDKVRKGDVLAVLFVPELGELWGTKKANVDYAQERVRVTQKDVDVTAARVKAARARLEEAKAILAKYEAEVVRWDVQVKRLAREVERQVIAPQILLESQNELKADIAARDAAVATVARAAAELEADEAALARAEVDVSVATAALAMAQSESRRIEALVGYLKLYAPYDGIIVARNANTWDFVLPQTGDPTAEMRSPDLSPGEKAAPIYVVNRTDIVRVFVDIPERDANYVHVGSEARVKIWAFRDEWIPATVTRLAWALNVRSRTMRAEIDLPNTDSQILPGMYAYGKVVIERSGVQAIPEAALSHAGGKSFVWRYEKGHAKRTEVETGIRDGEWIELRNRRVDRGSTGEEQWIPIDGSERILSGSKLSILTEGADVRVANPPAVTGVESLERNNAIGAG